METEGDNPSPFTTTTTGGGGNAYDSTGMALILAEPKKDHEIVISEIQNAITELPSAEVFTSSIKNALASGVFKTVDDFDTVFQTYTKLYNTTLTVKAKYEELSSEFDQSEENRSHISGLITNSESAYINTEQQALILSSQVDNLQNELVLYKEQANLVASQARRLEEEKRLLETRINEAELIIQTKDESISQLVAQANEKIQLTEAEATEKLSAQESQLIQYNSINQDLQSQIVLFNNEIESKNQQIFNMNQQIEALNQNIISIRNQEQIFRETIQQQKQQDLLLKQQEHELKIRIQNEFNERLRKVEEEKRLVLAQLEEKTEENALILREREEQNSLVLYNQQASQQNETLALELQQRIQEIQRDALVNEQNSAITIQTLQGDLDSLQLTLRSTIEQNRSLAEQLELEKNKSQLVVLGTDEENQQNQLIILQQTEELDTIKEQVKRYEAELKKEKEAKDKAEKSLIALQTESKKEIQKLRGENEVSKKEKDKLVVEAKLSTQKIQTELQIVTSAKANAEKKVDEYKGKLEKEEKVVSSSKKQIQEKDTLLINANREKDKLQKELELVKKNQELLGKTTIPQTELVKEKQEKELLILQIRQLESQLAAQNQQLIVVQQQSQTENVLIEKEKEGKLSAQLQSTKNELESLKTRFSSLEKVQKTLTDSLRNIKISVISNEGVITEEKSAFNATQENNKSLLRLSPETKKGIQIAIKQSLEFQNLSLFDGAVFKLWKTTKIPLNELTLIQKNILTQLIVASKQGILPLPPSGTGIISKKPSSTKPKSEGSGGGGIKAPIGTLVIYDSSLHPMYHLEMILQQNMFNLAASPSVSSDNALYSVEVKFQTGIEANPTDQLSFVANNVTLQEAPEGGRQAYIISLGKDKKIEYTNIGLLSRDCIFESGLFSVKVTDIVDNSVVKEESLRYVIEPQINQPPYNTRAAVDISKGIKFYLRTLGKGTYFLEMIVIYQ
jgi:hypothetical protein